MKYYWSWDPFLSTLGYTFNTSTQTWTNTRTGESGNFTNGLIETKQNPAFKGIFDLAHDHGVKVLASIGGWSMSKHFDEVAADAGKRARFIKDIKKLINLGFDGIDVDWEYPGRTGMNFTGTQADFNNYSMLMEEIREAVGPNKLVSGCFNAIVKPNEFDWKRLDKVMDYFNMMTYDLNGGWSDKAGHNAPLFDYPNQEFEGLSLAATVDSLRKRGVNMKKVNLGGAFYGKGVICNGPAGVNVTTVKKPITIQPDGPILSAGDFDNFKVDVWDATPNYSYIVKYANAAQGWTEKWDNNAMVPYKTKGNYFLSYDNEKSVACKAQFIKDNDLAGIIVWQVYGDLIGLDAGCTTDKMPYCSGATSPLINEINRVFASSTKTCQYTSSISNNLLLNHSITLSPVPSTGKIQVLLGKLAVQTEISVYNMMGEEVHTCHIEKDAIIDLSYLKRGMYVLYTHSQIGQGYSKFILE